jgi:protein SCO1
MRKKTVQEAPARLSGVIRFMLLVSLAGCGMGFANAAQNGESGQSMQDMPGMEMKNMPAMDMKDMSGMKPMDAMHMAPLPDQGHYTRSEASYVVPDVKLIDANGKPVRLRALLAGDAPVLLNFIFTTCTTLCPAMSGTFQNVQGKLGPQRKDVHLVSISIDPENDTPEKLKEYAARFKAGRQWTFLTGTLDDSVSVQKAFGNFAGEKMNHKPLTFIKPGGTSGRWLRIEGLASAEQIINEYDKLGGRK